MNNLFIIIVLTFCLINVYLTNGYTTYSDFLFEEPNSVNLTGKNVIVVGDSSARGHGIATILTHRGANVYGMSSTKGYDIPDMIWNHFTGLYSKSVINAFVKKLKHPNKWNVTKIDVVIWADIFDDNDIILKKSDVEWVQRIHKDIISSGISK
jgi:hypothetical protein